MGRTRRWLESLAEHEAKKKRTCSTAVVYGRGDNGLQDSGPKKSSEVLEWDTDKTDKKLDQPDTDETLTLSGIRAEGQVSSDEVPNEMCKHDVKGGCWLCYKQRRFPSTEDREGGVT